MARFSSDQMLVVDMGAGSYVYEKIGHEIFNLERNPLDGNYYGYCPPWGNIDIHKLGATGNDLYVDNVLVIFVTKSGYSNNREIIGFYPRARAFSINQSGDGLNRVITEENGETKTAHYSVKSDTLYDLRNRSNKFIIRVEGRTAYMFRKQRFYGGTYPELDIQIIDYIENYIKSIERLDDDFNAQDEIQQSEGLPSYATERTADKPLNIVIGGQGKSIRKDNRISKEALIQSSFKCQIDPNHITFNNTQSLPYMEGHHLIPCTVTNANFFWERYRKNIDCLENIVCLCPTCHRAVHFGDNETVSEMVKRLYSKQNEKLSLAGIPISMVELLSLYRS